MAEPIATPSTPPPVFALFRDFDPCYRVDATGYNKIGYVCNDRTVVYPRFCGITKSDLKQIAKKKHRLIYMPFEQYHVKTGFRNNVGNIELFYIGINAIKNAIINNDYSYFDNPIKLPLLSQISSEEFKFRWDQLSNLLLPGDILMTFDSRSVISRVIAMVDHGTWSHSALYIGDGRICEAITAGVVERSIDAYRFPRFRIGVYWADALAIDREERNSRINFTRSQVGKPYPYYKVSKLAAKKLLSFRCPWSPRNIMSSSDVSPRFNTAAGSRSAFVIVTLPRRDVCRLHQEVGQVRNRFRAIRGAHASQPDRIERDAELAWDNGRRRCWD
jgi:hypothetical protein